MTLINKQKLKINLEREESPLGNSLKNYISIRLLGSSFKGSHETAAITYAIPHLETWQITWQIRLLATIISLYLSLSIPFSILPRTLPLLLTFLSRYCSFSFCPRTFARWHDPETWCYVLLASVFLGYASKSQFSVCLERNKWFNLVVVHGIILSLQRCFTMQNWKKRKRPDLN